MDMEMEATAPSVDDGGKKPRKGLLGRFSKKSRKSQKGGAADDVPVEEPPSVTPASDDSSMARDGSDPAISSAGDADRLPSSEIPEDGPRKGLLGRFRRKSRKCQSEGAAEEDEPFEGTLEAAASGNNNDDAGDLADEREPDFGKSVTRDGDPVISSVTADQFLPSDVREDDPSRSASVSPAEARSAARKSSRKSKGRKGKVMLDKAPTARESAYGGPPRYDWIDIETAAAVKVQSAYRRNKVMWELEKQGLSTAAMRNRQRARKSKQRAFHSEDVPSALACCGVGFLFGDATGEDEAVLSAQKREQYKEKKRLEEEEEQKMRKYKYRKKASDHIVEEFEVIDD